MTEYIPLPNRPDFIDNLPPVVEHLEHYDGRCSLEAATLLQGAFDTLRAPNGLRAWDEIVNAIGRFADLGQTHGDKLPPDTLAFICFVDEAFHQWGAPRERDDVMAELCRDAA